MRAVVLAVVGFAFVVVGLGIVVFVVLAAAVLRCCCVLGTPSQAREGAAGSRLPHNVAVFVWQSLWALPAAVPRVVPGYQCVVASSCSCSSCCAVPLRARDFLTSERRRRGLETTSQPRVFFFGGSGREGALANAPRRERFSTIKDGRCWSWCLLVSLLYSLLLLCAAVACSGLPDNRDGAPRARDNLATSCFFWLWPRRGARQRTSTGTLLDEKRRRALVAPSW